MSAAPGHPSLRAGIAAALSDVLSDHSQRAIGDELGINGTTVGRRGDDLTAWTVTDFLKLAVTHPELSAAVQTYLTGDEQPQGEAVAVVGDLHQALSDCARLISQTSDALSDGIVTTTESKALCVTIDTMMAHLNRLHRDLTAVTARARA
jgi:predicted transcriptional regulator